MMKTIFQFFLIIGLNVTASSDIFAEIQSMTVTSFNIKLYGQKTQIHPDFLASERDRALVNFLKTEVPDSDVYVFEEIMNKNDFI